MRLPGNTSGVWIGLFAVAHLAETASACRSGWGYFWCIAAGGWCIDYCCLPRPSRKLADDQEHPFSAVEDQPTLDRQLQSCMRIPPCPPGNDLCDDPHMTGLSGQSLEWSGDDGGWYALIQDEEVQINVRLTAPLATDFPDRQLVTGISVMSGNGHSLVVKVNNPYSVETTGCPDGVHPCLADGALRIAVNDHQPVGFIGSIDSVELSDGLTLSAANLPVECWQFGGAKLWATMYDEMLSGSRALTEETFEQWALKHSEMNMAAPDWCAKYISERGLADVQSTHAVLKIETPSVSVRVNVGINHQGDGEVDWDGRILPDLDFWQMNVGLEGLVIGDSLSGILGETARPVLDDNGDAILEGMEAIRGTVEDYRVAGALGVEFPLLVKELDA